MGRLDPEGCGVSTTDVRNPPHRSLDGAYPRSSARYSSTSRPPGERNEMPFLGIGGDGRPGDTSRQRAPPRFGNECVCSTLEDADRNCDVLGAEAPWRTHRAVFIDAAPRVRRSLGEQRRKPLPTLGHRFGLRCRQLLDGTAQDHFWCMPGQNPCEDEVGPHRERCAFGQTDQGSIEVIQLLERSGVVEREAPSQHGAARDSFAEGEGRRQRGTYCPPTTP